MLLRWRKAGRLSWANRCLKLKQVTVMAVFVLLKKTRRKQSSSNTSHGFFCHVSVSTNSGDTILNYCQYPLSPPCDGLCRAESRLCEDGSLCVVLSVEQCSRSLRAGDGRGRRSGYGCVGSCSRRCGVAGCAARPAGCGRTGRDSSLHESRPTAGERQLAEQARTQAWPAFTTAAARQAKKESRK